MKLVFKNATWLIEQIDEAIAREEKEWEEYIAQWKFNLLSEKRYTWYFKAYYTTLEQVDKEINATLADIWSTERWVYAKMCGRVENLNLIKAACGKAKERDALVHLDDEDYVLIFGRGNE